MLPLLRLRTRLDRAILGSVLAMLAMNMVVLSQQLEPRPALAAAPDTEARA